MAKVTEASGGAFTQKVSYEFMVLTDAGEDDILYCSACEFCVNTEIAQVKSGEPCPKCQGGTLSQSKASEVGNVFDLGQKYGQDFDLSFRDQDGQKAYPIMGCYGIGISRLMGVIIEKNHDERGIVWPPEVAPALVYLANLGQSEEVKAEAESVYKSLMQKGLSVLWDDRDASAGVKLSDADLIGVPHRLVISQKTMQQGMVEYKKRTDTTAQLLTLEQVVTTVTPTPKLPS